MYADQAGIGVRFSLFSFSFVSFSLETLDKILQKHTNSWHFWYKSCRDSYPEFHLCLDLRSGKLCFAGPNVGSFLFSVHLTKTHVRSTQNGERKIQSEAFVSRKSLFTSTIRTRHSNPARADISLPKF